MENTSQKVEQTPSPRPEPSKMARRRFQLSIAVLCVLVIYVGWNFGSLTGYWGTVLQTGELSHPASGSGFATGTPDFDTSVSIIPVDEIFAGGPPKDGIPAISDPKFLVASKAAFLSPEDRVIGVAMGDEARAYPLRILNYHEIVNDQIGEIPLAVTYCPLCDSSVVFDRRTPLGELEFGVSGLLYNSNVLMYNRGAKSESLWSQLKTMGVTGPGAEETIKTLPLEVTSWQDWSTRYPKTKVLSDQTGHARDYSMTPYAHYFVSTELMFPVDNTDDRLPLKTPVLALWTDQAAKAYPIPDFPEEHLEDTIAGKHVSLQYNAESNSLRVTEADSDVQWMYTFWFAWAAFRPDTEIFTADQAN